MVARRAGLGAGTQQGTQEQRIAGLLGWASCGRRAVGGRSTGRRPGLTPHAVGGPCAMGAMRTPAWLAVGPAKSAVNDAPIGGLSMSGLRAVPSAGGNRGGWSGDPALQPRPASSCDACPTPLGPRHGPVRDFGGAPGESDGAVRRCLWTSSRAIGGAYEGHSFFRLVDPLESGDLVRPDRFQPAFACSRVLRGPCWRRTSRRTCCPRPMPTSLLRVRRVGGAADA